MKKSVQRQINILENLIVKLKTGGKGSVDVKVASKNKLAFLKNEFDRVNVYYERTAKDGAFTGKTFAVLFKGENRFVGVSKIDLEKSGTFNKHLGRLIALGRARLEHLRNAGAESFLHRLNPMGYSTYAGSKKLAPPECLGLPAELMEYPKPKNSLLENHKCSHPDCAGYSSELDT